MIPHHLQLLRETSKNPFSVMCNGARLAVLGLLGANDLPTEIVCDSLHAKAHTKDWRILPKLHNDFAAYSEVLLVSRIAGPRRDDDAVVRSLFYLVERYFVVAHHVERESSSCRKYLPHVLVEVVCE